MLLLETWDIIGPRRKREYHRKRYQDNPDRTRKQKARWRKQNPERHREHNRKWRKDNPERSRELNREHGRKYRQKYPERNKARAAANYAQIKGILKSPGYCENCGATDLPLEIVTGKQRS